MVVFFAGDVAGDHRDLGDMHGLRDSIFQANRHLENDHDFRGVCFLRHQLRPLYVPALSNPIIASDACRRCRRLLYASFRGRI